MEEAVIVSTARTAIGRAHKGSLAEMRPDDLAAVAIDAALRKVPELPSFEIEDLMLGCAAPGGEQGFNMARVVAILLGMDGLPGTTVTRYCASSLQTIRMAAHAVRAGEGHAFVAAGVETVSRFVKGNSDRIPDTKNPRFAEAMERTESAARGTASNGWTDPRTFDALPDVYIAMGQTAENVAGLEKVSREEQDAYAVLSQQRYETAAARGFWQDEIVPIALPGGGTLDHDESPRPGTTAEKLMALETVFRPNGTVTAGNSCPLNDGAAAVVVMSERRATELGIRPIARIVSSAVSAVSPEIMGLGPVEATSKALDLAGMRVTDIDLVELNEAFAAQVIPSSRRIGVDLDRLNPFGGAIALGHPFGMTGARIMTTLLHGLEETDSTLGLETMCIGGGQGMAMIVERMD